MGEKIRVMHYYTYPENSGGPLTYIKNLVASDSFVDVVFAEVYQGVPLSGLRLEKFTQIVDQIRSFSPDILHVHGVQSEGLIGLLAGKKAKVPKILMTVHGLQQDAQNISKPKRWLFKSVIENYVLKKADAVYCVCDAMTNRSYIRKNANNLQKTIHCFLPESKMKVPEHEQHSGIVFAYVGRICLDKGMRELEYCILHDENKEHRYLVIGSGDYEAEMREHLAEKIKSGVVRMPGHCSNVAELLKQADVFVFPTHHENLSIALLEACNAGLACIVTDVGGNTEVIQDQFSGRVIPANDGETLLRAVNEIADLGINGIRRMGEHANCVLKERFSSGVICKKINDLYHKLACEKIQKSNGVEAE